MNPVTGLVVLTLFTWGVAIWATFMEGEPPDETKEAERLQPDQPERPQPDERKAA